MFPSANPLNGAGLGPRGDSKPDFKGWDHQGHTECVREPTWNSNFFFTVSKSNKQICSQAQGKDTKSMLAINGRRVKKTDALKI